MNIKISSLDTATLFQAIKIISVDPQYTGLHIAPDGLSATFTCAIAPTGLPAGVAVAEATAPVAELLAYADNKLAAVIAAGISVNVAAPGAPAETALVDISSMGRADILGMMQEIASGATSITWYQSTGSLALTPAQLNIIASAAAAACTAAIAAWSAAYVGVSAIPPTITTMSPIDALFV